MDTILDHAPLFFDFDGLLVNTEHLHFRAYKKMLESRSASFPWDFRSFVAVAHRSAEGLRTLITSHVPELVASAGWETLYAEKQAAYEQFLLQGEIALMEGVERLLSLVAEADIPRAVVTHSRRTQTDRVREALPILNTIPHWITRADYKEPKPAPDGYLEGIARLGASDRMLGFEDSLRGVSALEAAGIPSVLVCFPDHPQLSDLSKHSCTFYTSFVALLEEQGLI